MVPRSRSTHHRSGSQDGGNRKQDHPNHTRDHEIRRNHIRVVPDRRPHLYRRLQGKTHACFLEFFCQDLGCMALTDQLSS